MLLSYTEHYKEYPSQWTYHFFAADLVARTSRLQTAPKGAVSLLLPGAFVAVLAWEDIESETILFFSGIFCLTINKLTPSVHMPLVVFTAIFTRVFSRDQYIMIRQLTT